MTLYAQQVGWFHSTPKTKDVQEKSKTRYEKIVESGGDPLMPEVEAEYVIAYWQQCGMAGQGMSGPVGLTAVELNAWEQSMGVELSPWEHKVIREMSRAYVAALHGGEEPDAPPPYGAAVVEVDRAAVSKKVSGAFKSLKRK